MSIKKKDKIGLINLFIKKFINNSSISLKKCSEDLFISYSTVKRWKKMYIANILLGKEIDSLESETVHKNNKRHKYTETVLNFIEKNIGCCLINISKHINDIISYSSICRILKDNKITHKKIGNKVSFKENQGIDTKRSLFCLGIDKEIYKNSLFIDEASFSFSSQNKYGYSRSGNSIPNIKYYLQNNIDTKRVSVLSLIDSNGVVQYELFDGSVKSDGFKNFLESSKDLIGDRKVFLDNAPIHKSKKVIELVKELKIDISFLPPYSPDLNPIELFFNSTKRWFRSNIKSFLNGKDKYLSNSKISIDPLIDNSIDQQNIKKHFINYYEHSLKIIENIKNITSLNSKISL